jgi:hypothetical protein
MGNNGGGSGFSFGMRGGAGAGAGIGFGNGGYNGNPYAQNGSMPNGVNTFGPRRSLSPWHAIILGVLVIVGGVILAIVFMNENSVNAGETTTQGTVYEVNPSIDQTNGSSNCDAAANFIVNNQTYRTTSGVGVTCATEVGQQVESSTR